MKFESYLLESKTSKIIVVDVQPFSEEHITFNIPKFMDYLNNSGKILYFFNGEELQFDKKDGVVVWCLDNGLKEDKLGDVTFSEKSYGYLRGWMDYGIDDEVIVKALKYMLKKDIWDSRDIQNEKWQSMFLDIDIPLDDPIYLPRGIDLKKLRAWNNSFLCGGGMGECLKEIQLLMEASNIKYRLERRFIY